MTEDTGRGIRFYVWAYDRQHLLYIQDTGGDENWRLYAVDLETAAWRDLTPFDGSRRGSSPAAKAPDEVLIGSTRDDPQLHDVYRSRSPPASCKLIENPGYVGWIADED